LKKGFIWLSRVGLKGQRYTSPSNRGSLTLEGSKALTKLLTANKRLNTAYVLKESFDQLWGYRTEDHTRLFGSSACVIRPKQA